MHLTTRMRITRAAAALAVTLPLALIDAAPAPAAEAGGYTVIKLLGPCAEADNDARDGAAFETECEQYIQGFIDALAITSQLDADHGICLPAANVRSEVRWAFMRWVHEDYGTRRVMPAGEAMLMAIKEKMACGG